MTNKELADDITYFFIDNDIMGGATKIEMYQATLRALNENDIQIIIDYFKDLEYIDDKAREIYRELIMRGAV